MTWTKAIRAEWDKHGSLFATKWLVSMTNLKKLRHFHDTPIDALREAMQEHSEDENVVNTMLKDVHLIEAAMATDWRVASLDKTVRNHFARLSAKVHSLRGIVWVNPDNEAERATKWLSDGAPDQEFRRLKPI
jgi:hypothetical protein